MIGGDADAASKTLLGVCESKSGFYFLIADPHFHGHADRLLLQSNGWVQWKHLDDVFKRESFYNFCLPQLRSEEYDWFNEEKSVCTEKCLETLLPWCCVVRKQKQKWSTTFKGNMRTYSLVPQDWRVRQHMTEMLESCTSLRRPMTWSWTTYLMENHLSILEILILYLYFQKWHTQIVGNPFCSDDQGFRWSFWW